MFVNVQSLSDWSSGDGVGLYVASFLGSKLCFGLEHCCFFFFRKKTENGLNRVMFFL